MLKKILIGLGVCFVALVALFAGLLGWAAWQSSAVADDARPFVEKVVPEIATWDYESFDQYLGPDLQKNLQTDTGQKVLQQFTRLGALESLEEPELLQFQKSATVAEGRITRAQFAIVGHFEAGDATMVLLVESDGDQYQVRNIHIDSDVFLQ